MTVDADRDRLMERLAEVVAAYGGDSARWPAPDRALLCAFVDADPDAKQLVGHGAAFDRLLDLAATDAVGEGARRARLADHLMAHVGQTAARERTAQHPTPGVIAFPARSSTPAPRATIARDQHGPPPNWMLGAALAASLVLGVIVGASGIVEPAATGMTELAGLGAPHEGVGSLDDGFGPVEEEFL